MNLPNNKEMALHRLKHLKRRFTHNEKYRSDYTTFMATIIQNRYAERVPPKGEEDERSQQVWHIPHHRVYHPKKLNKIRVLFDCSAKSRENH